MPFVTEEVWSWFAAGSVHRESWPDTDALRLAAGDPLVFEATADVLAAVRKQKSEQKRSLITPVQRVVVHDTADRLAALAQARGDLGEAGKIAALSTAEAAELRVEVELAPPETRDAAGSRRAPSLARRARQPRDGRRHAPGARAGRADARTHQHAAPVPRVAAARVPGDPPHRNERQDHHDAHGHAAARDRGLHDRRVHEPAPAACQRADRPQLRGDLRRRARRATACGRAGRAGDRDRPVVLRGAHRCGAALVRRRRGRRRAARGRPRRHLGRDQRGRRRRGRRHQREHRPHAVPRHDGRGDRDGEGGDRQGEEPARARRDRSRSRGAVHRPRPRRRDPPRRRTSVC